MRVLALLLFLLSTTIGQLYFTERAHAQIERPDRRYLFEEDRRRKEIKRQEKLELKARREQAAYRKDDAGELPFDINAKTISFDSTGRVIEAEGDVIITYSSIVAEALRGKVNTTTNDAELSGDVRISDVTANMTADSATLDLDTGAASLSNSEVFFAEGDYRLQAKQAERKPGDVCVLENAELTTCQCPEGDDCRPWTLRAKDAEITREGYGLVWNTTLAVHDVPVFYFPFLVFPAKNERQSGFLPATFGNGRQSGFDLYLPFFWAIGESTDATITGVYESNVRTGTDIQFRKVFSYDHQVEAGLIYLNEGQRNGDLLGTNVDDLDDPTFDENRVGAYIEQSWGRDIGGVPVQFFLDGNYVSDDLFLREYDKNEIGEQSERFVTSRAVLRAPFAGTFSADLIAEYNQALVDDDDFVFQRLPELAITGIDVFRPFGENQYGLKLVAKTDASATNFTRRESFEGTRTDLRESIELPFYFRNYFDGSIETALRGTYYSLTEEEVVFDNDEEFEVEGEDEPVGDIDDTMAEEMETFQSLEKTSNRLVPEVAGELQTVVEKVFDVGEGNLVKSVAELGRIGRSEKLVRLKHTIEPEVRYRYVPFVNQDDNPQFDSLDRLAQRNVVTYGVTQRLFGRFEPRNTFLYGIEEAAPEPGDLGNLRSENLVDTIGTFGFDDPTNADVYRPLRRGSVVELASLRLSQSYDILENRKDLDPFQEPVSDLAADLQLFPNEHVKLRTVTDFDVQEDAFRSYTVEGQLTSKRGDNLRSRLRFVEDRVRQLESGVELRMTENVLLGYYGRFDDLAGEFLEQRAGVRLSSSCRCWVLDFEVSDEINPDETKFAFNLTLVGLGELGNTFFSTAPEDRDRGA